MIPSATIAFLCAPLVVQGARKLRGSPAVLQMRRTTEEPLAIGAQAEHVLTTTTDAVTDRYEADEPWAQVDPTVHLPIF